MQCPNCKAEITNESANFCIECGYALKGTKGKVRGYSKKISSFLKKSTEDVKNSVQEIGDTLKDKFEIYRTRASERLSTYIASIEKQKQVAIKGYVLTDTQKEKMLTRLKLIQTKLKTEDFNNEEEYNEWIDQLDTRLENSRCIICFQEWNDNDEVVVCNGCYHGGHKDHFLSWVKNSHNCPLCRKELMPSDLIKVSN